MFFIKNRVRKDNRQLSIFDKDFGVEYSIKKGGNEMRKVKTKDDRMILFAEAVKQMNEIIKTSLSCMVRNFKCDPQDFLELYEQYDRSIKWNYLPRK